MPPDDRSHSDDERLLEVAAALADGQPIEWPQDTPSDERTSGVIARLRAIGQLRGAFDRAGAAGDASTDTAAADRIAVFTWGPLEVLELLGEGGFGQVYLARDPALNREVALKLHRRESCPAAAAEFQIDEARRLARVRHPNILTIYGAAVHDGVPGLWSDFIRGQTLEALLAERGPFGPDEIVSLGIDLGHALAALHANGIVHGDVKASNVMREDGGRVVLMDLGAGRLMGASPRKPVYATRSSAAPEVLAGEPPTVAADVYSLGALLFRLLTGAHRPETAASLRDLRPDVPATLAAVVDRALADDPGARFSTAGAMADALQLTRSPPGAANLDVPARRSRHWWPWTAAAAIGMVAMWTTLDPAGWRTSTAAPPLRMSGQRLFTAAAGSAIQGAFSPDAARIAFIGDASGTPQLWVQDRDGGDPRRLTDASVPISRPSWTPDGSRVVYTARGEIQSVPPDGGEILTVTRGWNADVGRRTGRIVFERGDEIWIADADGGNARKVAGIPERATRIAERLPVFSPDESLIAFMHADERPWGDVWIVPADGGAARRLTTDAKSIDRPSWTPDGRRVVFASRRAGATLWQADVEATPAAARRVPAVLLEGAGEDTSPVVSADGRSLLFTGMRNRNSIDLWNPATGEERTLREWRAEAVAPSLSSDGRRIVYFGWGHDGELHVYTMNADGGDVVQITAGPGDDGESTFPIWSADDREIYFYRVTPPRSWRRVSAAGGPSVEVRRGWDALEQPGIRLDAPGRRAIYTWHQRDAARATRIVDLQTGIEREFHRLLRYASFSPDGLWVVGADAAPNPQAKAGPLVICPIEPGPCRPLSPVPPRATYSKMSADGSTVYFQVFAGDGQCELWIAKTDGTGASRLRRFTTYSAFLPSFDLSPSGEVLLQRFHPGRHELWIGELRQ